jgi:hypothetical protein
MKTIINRYLLILLTAIVLLSCSDEDNPFKGNNAHIISFALTVDGVKYPASITENDIIITVPQSINLASANVEYKISENATLQPDPKTISNWNEEQIFRVNAWNDEFESYKYIVKRTEIIDPDNVVLLTQADVSEFAKKGINKVKGNLIIGHTTMPGIEFDTIKDLRPLRTITSVDLNIVINNSCLGCNFEGLNSIKSAGGFYLGTLSESSKATKAFDLELFGLEKVNNLVINTDSLKSFSVPQLRSAGNVYINSNKLASLDISSLEDCAGDFILKAIRNGNYAAEKSNTLLKKIDLAKLNSVGGTLWMENFWKVSELNLSKLNRVNQDLQLRYVRSIPKISLPELTTVAGLANIECNDGMTEFLAPKLSSAGSVYISSLNVYSLSLATIDLASLSTVEKDFTVRYASSTKLELPQLSAIGEKLHIESMPFLETILLPDLTGCDRIELSGNSSLTSFGNPKMTELNSLELASCNKLAGLKMPEALTGDLSVDFGGKASDLPNLKGLEEVKGILEIRSCASESLNIAGIRKLGSFRFNYCQEIKTIGFQGLEEVSQDFEISRLENLSAFSAPELESVGNDFTIKGCLVLTNIQLPKLTSITGQFNFYGASGSWQAFGSIIENMDAFSALTTVGSVDIRYAGNLSDYTGLENIIGSLSASDWTVQGCLYNPDYDAMVIGNYSKN